MMPESQGCPVAMSPRRTRMRAIYQQTSGIWDLHCLCSLEIEAQSIVYSL
jgi:hypothetical protein